MPIYPMRKQPVLLSPPSGHCDYDMRIAMPPFGATTEGIPTIRWLQQNYDKNQTGANLGASGYRPGLYLQTVTRELGLPSAVGCREGHSAPLLLPGQGYGQQHHHQQHLSAPGYRRDPHHSTVVKTMLRFNGPSRANDRPSQPLADGQKKGFTIDAILGHEGDIEGGQERLQMASYGDLQVTSRGDLQVTSRSDLQVTPRAQAMGERRGNEEQSSAVAPSEAVMRTPSDLMTDSSLAHVSPANDSSSSSSSSSSFSSSSPPSAAGHTANSGSLRPLTLFAERHERRRSIGSSGVDGRFITGGWKQNRGKRIRTIFTTEQLQRLEEQFEQQQYMVGTERYYLAMSLQLTEAQVKVWFQNRRIKWRKQSHERQYAKMAGINIYAEADDVDEEDDEEEEEEADDSVSVDSGQVYVNGDVTMTNLYRQNMAECFDHVSDMADCRNSRQDGHESFQDKN